MKDRLVIKVHAGTGGDGAVSFRREKYVAYGGPDGGHGGKGGSVYLKASRHVNTLDLLARRRSYKAEEGEKGGSRNKHGASGQDLFLEVPVGTQVFRQKDGAEEFVADLAREGEVVEVARGGRGGWGNARFATATEQVPRIAERGQPGEEWTLHLELKLIADVGIVGQPSVGKSSLLAAASAARPKVAPYPFTTKEPVLGVVDTGWRSFVLAEIPGLIQGAHLGGGLGHEFLRHAERTHLLIHLLDGSRADPGADLKQVNHELEMFDASLLAKPQVVVVNKIDLAEVRARLSEIDIELSPLADRVYHISAATGEGVKQLMADVARMLESIVAVTRAEPAPGVVFRPTPKDARVRVNKIDSVFEVAGSGLEALFAGGDLGQEQVRAQVRRRIRRADIAGALRRAGIRPGDKVRVGEVEVEWQ